MQHINWFHVMHCPCRCMHACSYFHIYTELFLSMVLSCLPLSLSMGHGSLYSCRLFDIRLLIGYITFYIWVWIVVHSVSIGSIVKLVLVECARTECSGLFRKYKAWPFGNLAKFLGWGGFFFSFFGWWLFGLNLVAYADKLAQSTIGYC